MTPADMGDRRKYSAAWFWAALATALVLRLSLVFYAQAGGHFAFGDGRFYVELGKSLAAGRGFTISPNIFDVDAARGEWTVALMERWRMTGLWDFVLPGKPTAFVMPLYPLFVGGVFALAGPNVFLLRLVQVLLALSVPALLYDVGRRVFGRPAALWGAWAGALYPFFVFYSASVTNQLFSLIALLAVVDAYLFSRDRQTPAAAALFGAVGGLAFLTRSEMLVPVAAGAAAIALARVRRVPARAAVLLAVAVAASAAVATPWAWRNHAAMGRFSYFATQAPRVLWEADVHPFSREFERGDVPAYARLYEGARARWLPRLSRRELVEMPAFAGESEFERADILRERVSAFVAANPGVYLDLCGVRARQLFRFESLNFGGAAYRLSYAVYGLVLLLGVAGAIAAARQKPLFIFFLLAYAVALLTFVVFGTAFRVTLLDSVLIVLGGPAVGVLDKVRRRVKK